MGGNFWAPTLSLSTVTSEGALRCSRSELGYGSDIRLKKCAAIPLEVTSPLCGILAMVEPNERVNLSGDLT